MTSRELLRKRQKMLKEQICSNLDILIARRQEKRQLDFFKTLFISNTTTAQAALYENFP